MWTSWCMELAQHGSEIEETLREEGLLWEGCVTFQIREAWYVALSANTKGQPASTEREINKKHREMLRECLGERVQAETLYYFGIK